jgi:hypothetical protein
MCWTAAVYGSCMELLLVTGSGTARLSRAGSLFGAAAGALVVDVVNAPTDDTAASTAVALVVVVVVEGVAIAATDCGMARSL